VLKAEGFCIFFPVNFSQEWNSFRKLQMQFLDFRKLILKCLMYFCRLWFVNFWTYGIPSFYVLCSLDVVSLQTIAVLLIRTQQTGRSPKVVLIPTLTVILGLMIQKFCASIANLARLAYWITSRLTGRRWLLSTSYSWFSWSLCTPLVAVHSGITGGTVGRDSIISM